MEENIFKIRLFLWFILFGVVFWLFWMAVVPSGKITYVNNFEASHEFIQKLSPQDRIETLSDGVKITGEPVYFALRTPRRFEKAKLIIRYKNMSDRPIIEIGPLVDEVLWQYDLRPIENKILDQLSMAWRAERDGELILLQRNDLADDDFFNSIQDFLNNPPLADRVAVYNYRFNYEYLIEDYQPESTERKIDVSLRGPFGFYTYIKDEDLFFNFETLNLNHNQDFDPVVANLYYQDSLIDSIRLEDDGASQKSLRFENKNLPEGVYKIEIKVSNDIVTEKITTTQSRVSFINKIWIYEGGENLRLFTDSQSLNAQTVNPGSLQKIEAGKQIVDLRETYKLFSEQLEPGIKEIVLEKDDVILSGNGIFAFSEDDFFNPRVSAVDANLDILNSEIDYVLARYRSPEKHEDWSVAELDLDISNAYREFYKHSFLISVPGLRSDDDIKDYVEIDEIRVELEGTSLWEKIKKAISKE